jgi:DsbC/DsbD-like thiol-disulfide interchange protein
MTNSAFYKIIAGILISWPLMFFGTEGQAEITKWQDLGGGRARLVTIYDPAEARIEGIIEVELQPGWVTYWRNPGEAGIPPIFDFSNSRGITVDQPSFPIPSAKSSSGITSIVYKDHVAFPFTGRPLMSPLSGNLQVDIVMGVCDEICIPAMASFFQDLSKLNYSDLVSNNMIELAKLKIPMTKTDDPEWPQILSSEWKSESIISIKVSIPNSATILELFAEGKESWFFYPAKLFSRDGGSAWFHLDMSEIPKDADLITTPLHFTLAADGIGTERTITVGNYE